ncbi:GATA zinc finger protein 3 [Ciborinia camelliae]|nr:GATA zinc finger protein 3 [Ciborinia camelliae]
MDHLRPSSRDQSRDLPPFRMSPSMSDGRQSLPIMPPMDPISRPSSTSTVNSSLHHSTSLPQLPGLSALASIASGTNSPQLRAFNVGQNGSMGYATSSPSATSGGGQNNSPYSDKFDKYPYPYPMVIPFFIDGLSIIISLHGQP